MVPLMRSRTRWPALFASRRRRDRVGSFSGMAGSGATFIDAVRAGGAAARRL